MDGFIERTSYKPSCKNVWMQICLDSVIYSCISNCRRKADDTINIALLLHLHSSVSLALITCVNHAIAKWTGPVIDYLISRMALGDVLKLLVASETFT